MKMCWYNLNLELLKIHVVYIVVQIQLKFRIFEIRLLTVDKFFGSVTVLKISIFSFLTSPIFIPNSENKSSQNINRNLNSHQIPVKLFQILYFIYPNYRRLPSRYEFLRNIPHFQFRDDRFMQRK